MKLSKKLCFKTLLKEARYISESLFMVLPLSYEKM